MKTIDEIRMENLLTLRSQFPSERQFAFHLNKAPNQVNQWLGKGAARAIQSESAREVEAIMGKPRGWLDNDHSQDIGLDAALVRAAILLAKEALRVGAGEVFVVERDPEAFAQALRTALAAREMLEVKHEVRSRPGDGEARHIGSRKSPTEDQAKGRPSTGRKRSG